MSKVIFLLLFCLSLFANIETRALRGDENSSSFFWIHEFIKKIKKDETLLCKERIDLQRLENLLVGYEYTFDPKLKELLLDEVEKTVQSYNYFKSNGCYNPKEFLEENFLSTDKSDTKVIDNPILHRLYKAFEKYKKIKQEGGWEPIVVQDILYLKKGQEYDVIPQICKRLKIEGYIEECNDSKLFNSSLENAVKEFQRCHSLKVDGIIGPMTVTAMNESVDMRLKEILINIERARWFVKNDNFFVFVDIPGFFLQVFKDGEPIFYSKVVVGRKSRPTPQMRNVISYAILNPYWRAPKTIIKEDILPHIKKGEFEELYKEGILASKDYYGKNLIAYEDVNWSEYNVTNLPFTFLQLPGDQNFLGRIKMMFPNRFDVYLHDTNERWLFDYDFRALSSGCVRVQKPLELFDVLLQETCQTYISLEDVQALLADNETKKIYIRPNIPVYLLYLTVYMDEEGLVSFFDDIYGIDKKMLSIEDLQKLDTIAVNKRKE
ncbi:L,D-transpeptidase family protein [Nitratiruptor tergarcus]|uniref:Uncharacterized protein conserved in bacteria n=1 Tax=Nitratiruptor tergarcus DSM 16512 TaxID=1069081 RepID=A0A1W1WT30_9BACT|nr:L,D-transpeptidase family protein [Nitratiruptor tergarcus]SMC09478.1 Uncharacterized protein conserved in bacteria [Nitratiruptor tergarcus DSM 16512]